MARFLKMHRPRSTRHALMVILRPYRERCSRLSHCSVNSFE
jgi:hypothetical protein